MQNEAFSRLRNGHTLGESYVDHDLNRGRQRRERTFKNSSCDPIIKKSGMSVSFFYLENPRWKETRRNSLWDWMTWWFMEQELERSSATSFLALAALTLSFQPQGDRSSTIRLRCEAARLLLNGVSSAEPSCHPLTTPLFPFVKCLPGALAAECGRKALHPDLRSNLVYLSLGTRQVTKRPEA